MTKPLAQWADRVVECVVSGPLRSRCHSSICHTGESGWPVRKMGRKPKEGGRQRRPREPTDSDVVVTLMEERGKERVLVNKSFKIQSSSKKVSAKPMGDRWAKVILQRSPVSPRNGPVLASLLHTIIDWELPVRSVAPNTVVDPEYSSWGCLSMMLPPEQDNWEAGFHCYEDIGWARFRGLLGAFDLIRKVCLPTFY